MNTVQRSPSRIGRGATSSASSANSPLMSMPSFSACSSRNEPGAGGAGLVHGEVDDDAVLQADELGVLAADLEDGVDLAADLAADEVGAGLVGGDLVGDDVGARELADELAARAGGADAEQVDAVADLVADLGEPGVDDLDGPRVGLDVDLLDHGAGRVDDDEVGGHRADVDAHVGVDPVVALQATRRASPCRAAARRAPSTAAR